jgi:hypothetical protein
MREDMFGLGALLLAGGIILWFIGIDGASQYSGWDMLSPANRESYQM